MDINKRTRLARLLIAPAHVVYEELRTYGDDVLGDPWGAADDELESKLAARKDRLIDLGLASYGASREIAGRLYMAAKAPPTDDADASYKQGLRLAVLGNQSIASKGFLNSFPDHTIGEVELAHVLKDADWVEAQTLVQNPKVGKDVLLSLYGGDKFAAGVDEHRRAQLVAVSGLNERLHTAKHDVDGPDFVSWDIHKAIFQMLETVPTSKVWEVNLRYLLDQLDPNQVQSPDSLDLVLERWLRDENGAAERHKGDYTDTGLSERAELRCVIAALYGRSWSKEGFVIQGSMDDADVARRCAYYGNANLDVKSVQAGYKKDGETFVLAAMLNDSVLLDRRTRKLFEDECINGGNLHRYRRRCEQLHKRWRSFDPRPTAEWMVEDETSSTDTSIVRVQVSNLTDRLARIEKVVALLPWLLLGTAALVLWQR